MHPLDTVALHAAIGRSVQVLAPVRCPDAMFEIARPYLVPIVTWRNYIHCENITVGQWRAADAALSMLIGNAPEYWRRWLEMHGDDPGSERAGVARMSETRYLVDFRIDDYVRVMAHWDRGGVWEFVLARNFADPIDMAPANAGPRQDAYAARCERITGRTPAQLWHDFSTAWAARPSLRRWGE